MYEEILLRVVSEMTSQNRKQITSTRRRLSNRNNPVRKMYVRNPEDWIYSSANKEKLLVLENALE